jgi:hypothetical protein
MASRAAYQFTAIFYDNAHLQGANAKPHTLSRSNDHRTIGCGILNC